MPTHKPSILFISSSTSIFDTIPDDIFKKWDFYLQKFTTDESHLNQLITPQLIILDSFNLGFHFLDQMENQHARARCPILVIDDYSEQVLIDTIIRKGASSYLHLDDFINNLEEEIEKLISTR